ncbi:nucleoside monophosphate kinase [Candidatus Saccharibacteria bacterium]|nr:nucleoside monophosphate kinase [Candidatus Saccharibacteria bacterium]
MILLMGPAGAGKSLQGHKLADEHGYAYISTGEIFRLFLTGKRRAEMLEGKLISDQETIDMIDKVFDIIDTKDEFILDGFPRTADQVDWLTKQVKKGRFEKPVVVHMDVSEKETRKRLALRGRPDDTAEAITERYRLYANKTQPILQQFRDNDVTVLDVDADGTPTEVYKNIVTALGIPEKF